MSNLKSIFLLDNSEFISGKKVSSMQKNFPDDMLEGKKNSKSPSYPPIKNHVCRWLDTERVKKIQRYRAVGTALSWGPRAADPLDSHIPQWPQHEASKLSLFLWED